MTPNYLPLVRRPGLVADREKGKEGKVRRGGEGHLTAKGDSGACFRERRRQFYAGRRGKNGGRLPNLGWREGYLKKREASTPARKEEGGGGERERA